MGFLSWRGLAIPKFSAPPSGETMRHTPKSFRGARTWSRSSITIHHAKFGGARMSPAVRVAKNVEFFCYRQHCAKRNAPLFNLLRGRFWGFSPRSGDTLHRWGEILHGRSPPPCYLSNNSWKNVNSTDLKLFKIIFTWMNILWYK